MNLEKLYGMALALACSPAIAQDVKFDVFGIQVGATPAIVSEALTGKGFSMYREFSFILTIDR
ncbi:MULTISPECIES: hypothetical protein [unclassified Mesorhizobium]|uniref:hypothetical protein n=1 Tax=unclassified Mesorhizobium TaxID=325217 RepID=UPI000FD496BC|nr:MULTISPECIES: hypothetical protein [unclassified Mesorhizobium]RUU95218.1 hypothetical protein EOA79_29000 [Mesorhizobium sp. M1A.F.Ca.IN.020.03.2.1]RWG87153.1 MAG: hypothetical protein EOQ70_14125 [Mesorhizobium sp.]RWK18209.1 MAG: hypothetical protein EOR41_13610 [Mesorhizobium sp.]